MLVHKVHGSGYTFKGSVGGQNLCYCRGGRCGLSKIRKKLEWGGGGDKARQRGLNAEVHRILCGHMHACSGKKEPTPWW